MAVTPTDAIAKLGNGDGFIYITKPDGSIISNIDNDGEGVRDALADGNSSAPIVGDIDATGTITITDPDTDGPARSITNITVNGVSVIDVASPIVITGVKEVTDVTFPADVSDSLDGKHWLLDAPDEKFYVWYDTPAGAGDPVIAGRTSIKVTIITNETADQVAVKTTTAITLINSGATFNTTVSSNVGTINNNVPGKVDDAVDVDAGVSVDVTTQGDNGRNDVATLIASAVDTFTPTSGVIYDATVTDNVTTLHAPAGQGKTLNGHVIQVTEDSTSVVIDIKNIDGGNDGSGIIDPTYGHKVFINANFSTDSDGNPTATRGILTDAVDITKFVVKLGMSSKIPQADVVIKNDQITIDRLSSTMSIIIDTEGAGAADKLQFIDPTGFVLGDRLNLRGKVTAQITTFKDETVSAGDKNINLANQADFSTGNIERNLELKLVVNDTGKSVWAEISRAPAAEATVPAQRGLTDPIPVMVPGTETITLIAGGQTISRTPGTDKGHLIVNGTVTFTASTTINGDGTPLDAETWYVDLRGAFTLDGNSLTIFGIPIPVEVALAGNAIVMAVFDDATSAYKARLFINFGIDIIQTVNIVDDAVDAAKLKADPTTDANRAVTTDHIRDLAVTTPKIAASAVDDTKLASSSVKIGKLEATLKDEVITVPVSFETNEIGLGYKVEFNYKCQVNKIVAVVTKAIAATDAATITPKIDTVDITISDPLSFPASTSIGGVESSTASANNIIDGTGAFLELVTAKPTAGGKALVSIHVTRIV